MKEAYEEKDYRKKKMKDDERLEKEKERKYFENLSKRENEHKAKKAAIEEEKNKIFEKLSQEQEKMKAEKDYWENVRNDLYVEEMNRREKIKEYQEMEKKQRQKEEMLDSAILTMRTKMNIKKEEERLENEFKTNLLKKFAEDERLEYLNVQKRKLKEFELKKEKREAMARKKNSISKAKRD